MGRGGPSSGRGAGDRGFGVSGGGFGGALTPVPGLTGEKPWGTVAVGFLPDQPWRGWMWLQLHVPHGSIHARSSGLAGLPGAFRSP